MDLNSKADRMIKMYDRHKAGVGCFVNNPSHSKERANMGYTIAAESKTPCFAQIPLFQQMQKKKSKSAEK